MYTFLEELVLIRKVNRPVIKRYFYDEHLFSVKEAEDCPAEMILLDLGTQDFQNEELAEDIAHIHKPVIVASETFDKDNVLKVNKKLHPYAVDVSEGLNKDGEKNPQKIQAFLRHIG